MWYRKCLLFLFLNFTILSSQKKDTNSSYLIFDDSINNKIEKIHLSVEDFNYKQDVIKTLKDSFSFKIDLDKPTLFKFYSLKPISVPHYIIITPGDSTRYGFNEKYELVFYGKNKENYEFYSSYLKQNFPFIDYSNYNNFSKYKDALLSNYQKKIEFLKLYSNINKNDTLFYENYVSFFKYEFFNALFNKNVIPKRAIPDFEEYSKGVSWDNFKGEKYFNPYYLLALKGFFYFKFLDIRLNEKDIITQYFSGIQLIENNIDGYQKEFLILNFIQNLENEIPYHLIDDIAKNTKQIKSSFRNKFIQESIEAFIIRLEKRKNKIPESVLDELLLSIDGKTLSFREILSINKTTIIDFWATWCSPCIEELNKSKKNRAKLFEANQNIVTISLDENKNKWKSKIQSLQFSSKDTQHFAVLNVKNSKLKQFLNLNSIPKIVLIENLFIVNNNAPKISENLEYYLKYCCNDSLKLNRLKEN